MLDANELSITAIDEAHAVRREANVLAVVQAEECVEDAGLGAIPVGDARAIRVDQRIDRVALGRARRVPGVLEERHRARAGVEHDIPAPGDDVAARAPPLAEHDALRSRDIPRRNLDDPLRIVEVEPRSEGSVRVILPSIVAAEGDGHHRARERDVDVGDVQLTAVCEHEISGARGPQRRPRRRGVRPEDAIHGIRRRRHRRARHELPTDDTRRVRSQRLPRRSAQTSTDAVSAGCRCGEALRSRDGRVDAEANPRARVIDLARLARCRPELGDLRGRDLLIDEGEGRGQIDVVIVARRIVRDPVRDERTHARATLGRLEPELHQRLPAHAEDRCEALRPRPERLARLVEHLDRHVHRGAGAPRGVHQHVEVVRRRRRIERRDEPARVRDLRGMEVVLRLEVTEDEVERSSVFRRRALPRELLELRGLDDRGSPERHDPHQRSAEGQLVRLRANLCAEETISVRRECAPDTAEGSEHGGVLEPGDPGHRHPIEVEEHDVVRRVDPNDARSDEVGLDLLNASVARQRDALDGAEAPRRERVADVEHVDAPDTAPLLTDQREVEDVDVASVGARGGLGRGAHADPLRGEVRDGFELVRARCAEAP
jgi:hypothetical protein